MEYLFDESDRQKFLQLLADRSLVIYVCVVINHQKGEIVSI